MKEKTIVQRLVKKLATEKQRLKDRVMALEDSMKGSSSKHGTPDGASREDGPRDRQM